MKYKNPYYRKIRGSHLMLISCGHCKTDLISYQKQGKGGLLRLHIDRIIESEFDLAQEEGALTCPKCQAQLGYRTRLKRENKDVYNMAKGQFNSRRFY